MITTSSSMTKKSSPFLNGTITALHSDELFLMIDGIYRSTINSEGKKLHHTEEGIRHFWDWFGDSKVCDQEGRPLVVYHGTDVPFDSFDVSKSGKKDHGWYGVGIYLTADKETASAYSTDGNSEDNIFKAGSHVIPVYVRAIKPLTWTHHDPACITKEMAKEKTAQILESGFDAVFAPNEYMDDPERKKFHEVVIYSNLQVKSAIGNSGDFSKNNTSLTGVTPFLEYSLGKSLINQAKEALRLIDQTVFSKKMSP
jgi:hypothetical protein